MVYYAITLALYMGCSTREVLRCLLGGLHWRWGAEAVKVAGKSGISQVRSRHGEAPLRRFHEELVQPIATRATKGTWYRGWRLVSLDGTCLDVADTEENRTELGAPRARRRWPRVCWRPSDPACCAWPAGTSLAIRQLPPQHDLPGCIDTVDLGHVPR